MKTIYFMRHGETDMNLTGRIQGQVDCPLNDTGRAQARKAAEALRAKGLAFDELYCSPLSRAAETAAIVTGRSPEQTHYDDRLKEMGFGEYEGVKLADVPRDTVRQLFDPSVDCPPGGVESDRALMARTGAFLEDLKHMAREGNTLVVMHGCAIRSIIAHMYGESSIHWKHDVHVGNCVVFCAQLDENGYSAFEEVLNLFREGPAPEKA